MEVFDETVNNLWVTRRKSKFITLTNNNEEYIIRSQTWRSSSKSFAYNSFYYFAYHIEDDEKEINEEKVNNIVKTFINTFKRNSDL